MINLESFVNELRSNIVEILFGHKVIVSRADLAKAWRDQINPTNNPNKVHDASGVFDSGFNDFCKQLGLKEGK